MFYSFFSRSIFTLSLTHPKWKLWLSNISRVWKCNQISIINSWHRRSHFLTLHRGNLTYRTCGHSNGSLCAGHTNDEQPSLTCPLFSSHGEGKASRFTLSQMCSSIVIIPGTSVVAIYIKHLDWFWIMFTRLHPFTNYFSIGKLNSLKSSGKPREKKIKLHDRIYVVSTT